MHPNSPCAPIRNEATLLATATLELPDLAMTEAVRAYAEGTASLCWLAMSTCKSSSSEDSTRDTSTGTSSIGSVRDDVRDTQYIAGAQCNESSAQGESDDICNRNSVLSSSAEGPEKGLSGLHTNGEMGVTAMAGSRSSGQQLARSSFTAQKCNSKAQQFNSCDDADPGRSLWLKKAALLYFGSSVAMARDARDRGEMLTADVSEVLGCGNYDVRAACLKALVRRVVQGGAFFFHLLSFYVSCKLFDCVVQHKPCSWHLMFLAMIRPYCARPGRN